MYFWQSFKKLKHECTEMSGTEEVLLFHLSRYTTSNLNKMYVPIILIAIDITLNLFMLAIHFLVIT